MVIAFSLKAASPVIAVLLLIAITTTISIIMYFWLTGYTTSLPSTNELQEMPMLKLEAISFLVDEAKPSYAYAIKVYVRNIGDTTTFLTNTSLYIVKVGNTVATGTTIIFGNDVIELKSREVAEITYYINDIVEPGEYIFKVVSMDGVEAAIHVENKYLIGKSTIHKVGIKNNANNKVISEDQYALYESWNTLEVGGYKIWFRVYAKQDITIDWVRAELFNSTGNHPEWVGGNPWFCSIWCPFTYPDYVGAEWYPVKSEEMPVFIIYTIYVNC